MPPHQPTPLNRDQSHPLLTSFPPFLLVAIHSLLYHRHLYPPTTFLSTRAYNLPVHQSRHPAVCAWIRSAVDALSIQLARGTVARVAVVMHAPAPSRAVLERWVFDTTAFPAWPAGRSREPARAMADFGRMMEREARGEEGRGRHGIELFPDPEVGGEGTSSRVRWPDVDEQLRGALRRLGHVAGGMGGLPEGSTYTVAVEMREEGRAPIEVCTFLGLVGFCCGLTDIWCSIRRRGSRRSQTCSRRRVRGPCRGRMWAVSGRRRFGRCRRGRCFSSAGWRRRGQSSRGPTRTRTKRWRVRGMG